MVEARERYRREKRKWHLLYDKLFDSKNLKVAWEQVEENRGAPGVSGQTIEQYAKGLEERLKALGKKLEEQSFRPMPIRRKLIPKGDGSGKMRELGIPEVEDRLVQGAVARLIEPIFESKFLEGSYGFRPERSAHHALSRVERAISGGQPYLVDADIRNCFGSIPHDALMEEVAQEISDRKLLKLIQSFVEADIVEEVKRWTPERGTPQGAVLSPLLANIYMHKFDCEMERAGYEVVRYADDFVVLCKTREEAEEARKAAEGILRRMGLELHPEKTRIVDAQTEPFQFLGYEWWPGGRQPRKPSLDKFKKRIREKTPRTSGESLRETIKKLNPTLRGWYGYFQYSFHKTFKAVDGFVRRRLRSILRKFEKRRGTAKNRGDNARYPTRLFTKLGLFTMNDEHHRRAGARKIVAFPAKA